jgi:hypothetical protein
MDVTSPEMWKQEWMAFTSAPYIILPFIVAGWLAGLWFRGRTTEGEIAGLKREISVHDREISVWELRLKLATDLVAAADRARDELDKQFQAYKAEVAAKGSNASPAKVEAALEQLNKEDALVTHALKIARQAVEARERQAVEARERYSLPVGLGYPVGTGYTNRLEATLRDLDGLGALRKADPETLDKIKDIGKPFMGKNIGTTLNSIPDDLKKRD